MKFIHPGSIFIGLLVGINLSAQTNLFPSSGGDGVGTTSPGRVFEVSGSGSIYSKVTSTNSFDAAIQFSAAGSDSYIGRLPTLRGGAGTMDFYDNGVRMAMDPSGNVGIGTSNPTQELSVSGTIRAKEVIADTGWRRIAPCVPVSTRLNAATLPS